MLLRRFNALPLPIDQVRSEMDRLLNGVVGPVPRVSASHWATPKSFPPINLWEDADAVYAEAELPGVEADSIDISVLGTELTVGGERKSNTEEGVSYLRQERARGAFRRTVRLPVEVDADAVSANMKDGVLTIRLPKHEATKPRKIKVSNN